MRGDRRRGRWCRTPRPVHHPRRARRLIERRAAVISRSVSARVNEPESVSAARARMARTALRARANTSSWTSSSRVASLVGTMMLRGTPSLVITRAPSRSRSAQTLPGLAANARDAIVFMHYIYTSDRSASRNGSDWVPSRAASYAASSRHTCVTRKQTVTPMASGISVATVVHLALRVSLKIV